MKAECVRGGMATRGAADAELYLGEGAQNSGT